MCSTFRRQCYFSSQHRFYHSSFNLVHKKLIFTTSKVPSSLESSAQLWPTGKNRQRHQTLIILYLHAKFQLQIYSTALLNMTPSHTVTSTRASLSQKKTITRYSLYSVPVWKTVTFILCLFLFSSKNSSSSLRQLSCYFMTTTLPATTDLVHYSHINKLKNKH